MLVLSRSDLEPLLPPLDVVEALEAAFRLSTTGRVHVPPRTTVSTADDGVVLVMPAAMSGEAFGTKLVTVYAGNRVRGHPTLYASYLLMDGATGQPLAILEATYLTALRTGATSAVAARALARPDVRKVVCFGAGAQAAMQLVCLAAVRAVEHVAVVGRDPGRARAFVAAMRKRLGVEVELAVDARTAVRDADLITCATTAPVPVVLGADLRPGTHLDLVGAFRPTEREADTTAVRRARVVVDTYAGALEEAGDVLIPMKEGAVDRDHVVAELAQVLTGAKRVRRTADDITLFKSVGWALEDLATARLAYVRARATGAGADVPLA